MSRKFEKHSNREEMPEINRIAHAADGGDPKIAEKRSKCHSLECRDIQKHDEEWQDCMKPEKIARH